MLVWLENCLYVNQGLGVAMSRLSLGTTFVLACSVLMVACGRSSHDRAEEVLDSAVERFSVLHARVDALVLAAEEPARSGCEGVDPVVNSLLSLSFSSDVRATMHALNLEYGRARAGCNFALGALRRELRSAHRLRDQYTPEAVDELVSAVRVRLAAASSDALERVLDVAATDEEAWVALYHVNSSGFGRMPDFGDLNSEIDQQEERMNAQIDDMARYRPIAVEKKAEFYELAGQPVPELQVYELTDQPVPER